MWAGGGGGGRQACRCGGGGGGGGRAHGQTGWRDAQVPAGLRVGRVGPNSSREEDPSALQPTVRPALNLPSIPAQPSPAAPRGRTCSTSSCTDAAPGWWRYLWRGGGRRRAGCLSVHPGERSRRGQGGEPAPPGRGRAPCMHACRAPCTPPTSLPFSLCLPFSLPTPPSSHFSPWMYVLTSLPSTRSRSHPMACLTSKWCVPDGYPLTSIGRDPTRSAHR